MRIVDATAGDIPRLEPLWLGMVAHHESVRPGASETVPFRAAAETWRRRRARYEEWIHEPDARVLIAEDGEGRALGYAFLRVEGGESTLQTAERIGHLESLAVAPDARGSGVGGALIEAAFEHFRALGLREISLAVMDGNAAAQRLYERHGLRPYYVGMLGRIPERPDAAERT